ncbi:MAG: DNA polymerase III subunit delta [Campylobacteraceae bacterium]|jgi:DNA polymerase-3 subunit delta|nr:DNA polymerase III subunit delta [Campylobacteraceae bacterium]
MYKKEFDAMLASKNIPRAIMFYGACDYQLSHLEESALWLWQGEALKLYFDEYDFKLARAHLSQASLFGDINILLLKLEKCPPKKEMNELVDLCKKQDINRLLFIYYGENTQTFKDVLQSFGKNFVRVFKPNINEATTFLSQEAKKTGLNIQTSALQYLYQIQNENLSLAVSELVKLSLLNKEISYADVNSLVFGMGNVDMETFISKLLNGENIIQLYKTVSQDGTMSEVNFINAIQKHIFVLFLFHAYIKMNGRADAMEILGHPLPPNIITQKAAAGIRLKTMHFTKLSQLLINAEYALKTNSNLDKEAFVIATLLEIQECLKG